MHRLIVILLAFVLSSCDRPYSEVDFEKEARESHNLEELLSLHEKVVAAQGKDIYFIQPIGRFGEGGLKASLEHIAAKGESISTYNNMELVFGVAVAAQQETGYVMCDDRAVKQRMINLADEEDAPSWQSSNFGSALVSFCEAGEDA